MTAEQFIKKMKEKADDKDLMGAPGVLIEFAGELSRDISDALHNKVCESTALVAASVLEGYAKAIRDSHKSDHAKTSELIYDMFAQKQCVSMKVPMDLKGEE